MIRSTLGICRRSVYGLWNIHGQFRTLKSETTQTTFGFDTVKEEERQQKVNAVFNSVAKQYNCMNDIMSLGMHRLWKDDFVASMQPLRGMRCLDVAGGTGDIAMRLVRHAEGRQAFHADHEKTKTIHVTVCDINPNMLNVGKEEAKKAAIEVEWVEGNAEKLPFPDASFDMYTIAFGLRNCTHLDRVLREAHRVLKPYGRFGCLEFTPIENPIIARLYDAYSFNVLPVLGELIARDWHAYRYLAESIRVFPNQHVLTKLMRDSGFSDVRVQPYALGIVMGHIGWKLN